MPQEDDSVAKSSIVTKADGTTMTLEEALTGRRPAAEDEEADTLLKKHMLEDVTRSGKGKQAA